MDPLPQLALKEMFAWKVAGTCSKDMWRCAIRESGSLSVMLSGTRRRQMLSVDSLDTMTLLMNVSELITMSCMPLMLMILTMQ